MAILPPTDRPEVAPPIVRGLTQLSPMRMQAVMGQQSSDMEQDSGEDSLPKIISEQGYLLARAAELGPDALMVMENMVKAVARQYRRNQPRMDFLAGGMPPALTPPLSMVEEPGADPRLALLSALMG